MGGAAGCKGVRVCGATMGDAGMRAAERGRVSGAEGALRAVQGCVAAEGALRGARRRVGACAGMEGALQVVRGVPGMEGAAGGAGMWRECGGCGKSGDLWLKDCCFRGATECGAVWPDLGASGIESVIVSQGGKRYLRAFRSPYFVSKSLGFV